MEEYKSTKRGKPVKPSFWSKMGFHWFGRDDQGISIWAGDKITLNWSSKLMAGIGAVALAGSVVAAFTVQDAAAPAVMAGVGALCLGLAWWMKRHYEWLKRLATVEQVAAHVGVDREHLDRLAGGRAIKPRVIMDGTPYYDPADLGEVAVLLRASEAPPDDLLLRPAPSARTEDSLLLQPASESVEAGQATAVQGQPADVPLNLLQQRHAE
jgi:hypothetical protein